MAYLPGTFTSSIIHSFDLFFSSVVSCLFCVIWTVLTKSSLVYAAAMTDCAESRSEYSPVLFLFFYITRWVDESLEHRIRGDNESKQWRDWTHHFSSFPTVSVSIGPWEPQRLVWITSMLIHAPMRICVTVVRLVSLFRIRLITAFRCIQLSGRKESFEHHYWSLWSAKRLRRYWFASSTCNQ